MKNFLIAITIFILTSCSDLSDPRAKDIEMLVNLEMQYGDMTRFEAECFISIWSDAIEDDDAWDWLVAKATSTSPTTVSENPTRFEVEIGAVVAGSIKTIRDECGFDFIEVVGKRL